MTTIRVSLPDTLKKFIDRQVEQRRFEDVNDYFRSLIREDRDRLRSGSSRDLESLLIEGLNSGPTLLADEAYWAQKKDDLRRTRRPKR